MRTNYQGAQIVIIGLGITGLSCINFFLNKGITPKVIDTRLYPPTMHKLPNFIEYCFGKLHDIWILNADLIVVSPGVRLDNPIFVEAMRLGIEIIGDIELFIREVTVPIVAITGSNGKSTVTRLVGNMAQCAGWRVGVVGNIGIPALTLLNKGYQLYILEISSFQLDITYNLRATVATILNISADHMDRYPGGLNQYHLSKKKIYRNAITCVVNDEDPLTKPLLSLSSCDCSNLISFGVYSNSADYRLEYYRGNDWIVVYNNYVLNCSKLKTNSYINYINILSSLALSDSIQVPRQASLKALCKFYGLSHRLQLIYKNRGVSWINDSKATNIGATKKAIQHVIQELSGRLHLLLGGDAKFADFAQLKYLINQYDIHLYCFGKDGSFLTKFGSKNIFLTNNMSDTIHIISRRIHKKDIVLLSPACSSLDQFTSFISRGKMFTSLAQKLG